MGRDRGSRNGKGQETKGGKGEGQGKEERGASRKGRKMCREGEKEGNGGGTGNLAPTVISKSQRLCPEQRCCRRETVNATNRCVLRNTGFDHSVCYDFTRLVCNEA